MYKDRGFIKWQPFDALTGFRESIEEMLTIKEKKVKKILLEDRLTELDYIINEAINFKKELFFEYFNDGYYKQVYGSIKKINYIEKIITLDNNIKVNISDITNLEFT